MLLRKDDAWLTELPIPDIRDWRVVDRDDKEVGFVQTVVVDRQNNAFEAVLTGANDRFSADDVDVEDHVIRVQRSLRRSSVVDEMPDAAEDFETAFQRHFEESFSETDWSYDHVQPAYQFGREIASDADFSGRSFSNAEEDVCARYVVAGLRPSFDTVREAVRHGFRLAHGTRPYEGGGIDREAKQILDGKTQDQSARAGASMSTLTASDDDDDT